MTCDTCDGERELYYCPAHPFANNCPCAKRVRACPDCIDETEELEMTE